MKDSVLIEHPTLGIITFEDVIRDLEIMLEDSKLFDEVVYQILKSNNISESDIASLFNYSVTNRIEWVLTVLQSIF